MGRFAEYFKQEKEAVKEKSEMYYGLQIYRSDSIKGHPCVKIWINNQSHAFANYSFRSPENREKYIEEQKANAKANAENKAMRQMAKQKANAEFINPYKAGDIYYSSWGYEQTNIDWYQVTRVDGKTVYIRPIAAHVQETGFMTGPSEPVRDHFTGPEEKKIVQISVDYYGKPVISISMKYGGFSPYQGRAVTCSWYA